MIEHEGLDMDMVFAAVPRPRPTCAECISLRGRLDRALEWGGERGIIYATGALDEHVHEGHPA